MAQKSYYSTLMSNLDNIDSVTELDEEQVLKIKEKFKQVETVLKNKIKPKTITISGPSHTKIRDYCALLNENIGEWCDKVLINFIAENPPVITLQAALRSFYSHENLPEFIKCLLASPLPYDVIDFDEWKDRVIKDYSEKGVLPTMNSEFGIEMQRSPINRQYTTLDNYQGGIDDYYDYSGKLFLK